MALKAVQQALTPLLLLPLMFLSSSSFPLTGPDGFLHCFRHRIRSSRAAVSQFVLTPNTVPYNTTFHSNIQNLRHLSPPSTKPSLIVTPTDASHVQASVVCSRAHGLRLRTRSGGHDYEGLSYISNGHDPFVVLDLGNLRSVEVDTEARTAWVGVGATLGELYNHVAGKSPTLGFSAGICPTIGIGGHLTGGGIGTMMRKYGIAADNIVDAKSVDADGKLLDRYSMGEDLFWAIRGGGASSFCVILSYKVNLVPVPPKVTVFSITRSLKQNATKIVSRWEEVASRFDKDLFVRILAHTADDAEAKGRKTVNAVFQGLFLGDGGSKDLISYVNKAFPEIGVEAKDLEEMPWIDSVKFFAGLSGNGTREVLMGRRPAFSGSFKAKSDFVQQPIGERGWESIWKFLLEAKDEPLMMILDPWGGVLDEVPEGATPFPHRKGNLYNIQYFMRWSETTKSVTQRHLDRMRKLYNFMAQYVSSNPRAAYLNYRDLDLGINVEGKESYASASAWGRSYFKDNFERLAAVKGAVDPSNFFRHEQSIPPSY